MSSYGVIPSPHAGAKMVRPEALRRLHQATTDFGVIWGDLREGERRIDGSGGVRLCEDGCEEVRRVMRRTTGKEDKWMDLITPNP